MDENNKNYDNQYTGGNDGSSTDQTRQIPGTLLPILPVETDLPALMKHLRTLQPARPFSNAADLQQYGIPMEI